MKPRKSFQLFYSITPALIILLLLFFSARVSGAQGEEPVFSVDSPRPGDALQGVVTIAGTTGVPGFRSVDVAFAYQSDSTGTWFPIAQSSAAVQAGAIAGWDTTTITDGNYRLRVQVFLQDGRVLESVVEGLRVRNYLPVETSTPHADAPPVGQPIPTSTPTPLADFQVSARQPTPLPTNPAQVTQRHLQTSVFQGMLAAAGVLAVVGMLVGLRAALRR